MENLDKIIAKIQGLLKLAQDNPDDEEGQTALNGTAFVAEI